MRTFALVPVSITLIAASQSAIGQDCPPRWRQVQSAGVMPAARGWHSMVYAGDRIVLFGGQNSQQRFGDTWEWSNDAWEQRCVECGPAPRQAFGMAYDVVRSRVVVFGGNTSHDGSGQANLDDTWEWDGATWIGPILPEPRPAARSQVMMSYDPTRSRVLLFGGALADGTIASDTWEWNGTIWERRAVVGPGRYNAAMSFDSTRGATLLFGGTPGTGDTWLWNGVAWEQASGGPPPRHSSGLVDRPEAGRVMLHGGTNYDGDTWEWDGAAWHSIPGLSPPVRHALALALEEPAGRALLFGGSSPLGHYLDDLWEYGPFDLPADFNNDCNINPDDLGDFIDCFFAVPICPEADFNGDGNIDPDDLGDFINAYFAG